MSKTGLSLVLLLASMGTALAQDRLITPTLFVIAPDNFACNLTNVSEKVGTAHVVIISNGAVLEESGEITVEPQNTANYTLSLIHISEPTRRTPISYAVF